MFQCQQNNGCSLYSYAWPLNLTRRSIIISRKWNDQSFYRLLALLIDLLHVASVGFNHFSDTILFCQSLYLPLFVFDVNAFLPLLVGICRNC